MWCVGLDLGVEGVVIVDIFMGVVMGEYGVVLIYVVLCVWVCRGVYIWCICLFSLVLNYVGGIIRDLCVVLYVIVNVFGIIFGVGEEELLIDKGLWCIGVCKICC